MHQHVYFLAQVDRSIETYRQITVFVARRDDVSTERMIIGQRKS
jgi:hypothetical protein